MKKNTLLSAISGKSFPAKEMGNGKGLTPGFMSFIQTIHPDFTEDSHLSYAELNELRKDFIQHQLQLASLEINAGGTSSNDENLLNQLKLNIQEDESQENLTNGQRIADKVAEFGGSWTFIISFGIFITLWICLNVYILKNYAYDPYPFILLNLILSCIAALQAPIIMMSQNRQEEKDRARSKKDYLINLKSELEIRNLHEKLDHLMIQQHERILEIQQSQLELMSEYFEKLVQTGSRNSGIHDSKK